MIQPPQEDLEQRLLRSIHDALDERVKKIKEQVMADAIVTFTDDMRAAIGTTAIKLSEYYSIERNGVNLVITVNMGGKK
jgi:hypothetical protein